MDTSQKPAVAMRMAAEAALQAARETTADAVRKAATNAAKPGSKTTEFKTTVCTIGAAALFAALKVLAVIPGPWTVPAAVALAAMAAGSAGYSISRGKVKAAALDAAATAINAAAAPPAERHTP